MEELQEVQEAFIEVPVAVFKPPKLTGGQKFKLTFGFSKSMKRGAQRFKVWNWEDPNGSIAQFRILRQKYKRK